MSGWVQLVEGYVKATGPSTAEEIADGTGLPLGFVRNGLAELGPADPEAKDPPPRAGTFSVERDRFAYVGLPAPPPEPRPCGMTGDHRHVPTGNPLNAGQCAACGRKIGPTDPVNVLQKNAR